MKTSKDYHDYVFKNGKYIGKFEDMYRYSDEIPWKQDKVIDRFYRKISLEIIKSVLANQSNSIKSTIEVGCGYGYVLSRIYQPGKSYSGFDISATAIERAKEIHSKNKNIHFFVDDIIHLDHAEKYDLVLVLENLWYVIDHIEKALSNIVKLAKRKGYLFVSLAFPDLTKAYYGKKLLPNPETLIDILSKYFDTLVINTCVCKEHKNDGPMLSYLGRKK